VRIAFLSSQAGYYGGEVHLLQLARGLAQRGHEVACCVPPGSGLAVRLTEAGLDVTTVRLVDWFEPVGTARAAAWLRRRRPDILHTHCPRDHYLAAVVTRGLPTLNVGTRHELRPIGAARLKRPFFRRFAAMIAVSEAVRAVFVASLVMDPDRVVTVRNGVDTDCSWAARGGLRRLAGLDADAPVVGYVGRLSPGKGIDTLIEAMALLRRNGGPRARLFIVGDDPRRGGAYGGALRRHAARLGLDGSAHFFGWIENAAAAGADFDLQVVPSRAEPCGLTTLEGMAHGHAIIATAAGGSPELIRDGREGLLVPPGDPAALAARLARLLGDPELRARLGAAARRRVVAEFPLSRMLDGVEGVYRHVGARRAPDQGVSG
jgi:glycosyltransferase involved in cell wall biosynthesis